MTTETTNKEQENMIHVINQANRSRKINGS